MLVTNPVPGQKSSTGSTPGGASARCAEGLRVGRGASRFRLKQSTRRAGRGALLLSLLPMAVYASVLAPLEGPAGSAPQAPWTFAGLPNQTLPATRFAVERQGGRTVLRIQAAASYGFLVHPVAEVPAGRLSWRWRVDKPLTLTDLRTRRGDDVALKVCVLFDGPRDTVPFVERQLLRLAESRTGQALPIATLCYAWDPSWPPGSVVPNAYSRRVRYITLGSIPRSWQDVSRDLAADFVRAFGDETASIPKVRAVAVGADADNTGGDSLGYISDLEWVSVPDR